MTFSGQVMKFLIVQLRAQSAIHQPKYIVPYNLQGLRAPCNPWGSPMSLKQKGATIYGQFPLNWEIAFLID